MSLLDILEETCTMLLLATMVASMLGWLQAGNERRTRPQDDIEIDIFNFESAEKKRPKFFKRNIRRPKWNPPLEIIKEDCEITAKCENANSTGLTNHVPAHEQAGGSIPSTMPTLPVDTIASKTVEVAIKEEKPQVVVDHVLLPDRSQDSEQSSDELTTDYTPPPQEVTSPRKSFFSIYLKLPKALFSCFQPITSSLDEDIKVKDKDCAASCPLNDTDLVVQVDQFEPQPTTKSPQAQEPIRARHRRTMSHAVTEFEAILNSDINREPKTQMSSNEQRPGTLHENATKSGLVKPYRRKFRPFRCFSKIPSSSKLRHTYPGIIYQPRN